MIYEKFYRCKIGGKALKNKIVLVLMQLKGISRKTILKSFSLTPGLECSINSISEIIKRASIEDKRIKALSVDEIQEAINRADKIIEESLIKDIKIVTYLDEEYPKRLRSISDPPTVLYYKGNISYLNEMNAVAIIGTRKPTEHGMKIARNLGESFGKRNYVVVSGLAIGCDTFGHEGCLNVNGKTVAVMAGGLNKIYPAKNNQLAQRILDNGGALISEYAPYVNPFKNYFVERDRIQSGLSDGVLVVETGETGGTLHTVGYAQEYNRVLACYKHPDKYLTEPKTLGNQKLIREGKAMAVSNDIELGEFRKKMETKENETKEKITGTQETIFDLLN